MEKNVHVRRASAMLILALGSLIGALGPTWADDVQMHQFWNDQSQSKSTTPAQTDPSARVPDNGRATYNGDDTDATPAPVGRHHLRHHRSHAQS